MSIRYVLFILNINILRRWRPGSTCSQQPKREAPSSRIRVLSTCLFDTGSPVRTKTHHACLLSKRNVLLSSIPLCNALKITLENQKIAFSFEKRCSTAANQASKRLTVTPNISIDQNPDINSTHHSPHEQFNITTNEFH